MPTEARPCPQPNFVLDAILARVLRPSFMALPRPLVLPHQLLLERLHAARARQFRLRPFQAPHSPVLLHRHPARHLWLLLPSQLRVDVRLASLALVPAPDAQVVESVLLVVVPHPGTPPEVMPRVQPKVSQLYPKLLP